MSLGKNHNSLVDPTATMVKTNGRITTIIPIQDVLITINENSIKPNNTAVANMGEPNTFTNNSAMWLKAM